MSLNPPLVKILVTVPDLKREAACTLCFDTLRVGFPTSEVQVFINPVGLKAEALVAVGGRIAKRCLGDKRMTFQFERQPIHHAVWIRREVFHKHESGGRPLVILDADTIFWKSCEDWTFPDDALLAGYYVPRIWNDFAKCISFPRIHTSMMWFKRLSALRGFIEAQYPFAYQTNGDYCPCDPFMPAVRFIDGKPYFWDTCANLYQMLGPDSTSHLKREHLECFDHINSASFYDVMEKRLEGAPAFKLVHNELIKTPERLRNLWPNVASYYMQKEIEAQITQPKI